MKQKELSNTIAESHELCRSLVLTTEQSTYERSGDCIFYDSFIDIIFHLCLQLVTMTQQQRKIVFSSVPQ